MLSLQNGWETLRVSQSRRAGEALVGVNDHSATRLVPGMSFTADKDRPTWENWTAR